MAMMQKISTNLWFDSQGEEAANFYVSIFKHSKIGRITRFSDEGFEIHQRPAGSVMTIKFFLEGQTFVALNGGPVFKFNEAISLIVNCETQEEIDYYWDKLSEGGDVTAQQCGWLKDKFGLSWQIIPAMLDDMFVDSESDQAKRAMKAMLGMKKLNIDELQKAYDGR